MSLINFKWIDNIIKVSLIRHDEIFYNEYKFICNILNVHCFGCFMEHNKID